MESSHFPTSTFHLKYWLSVSRNSKGIWGQKKILKTTGLASRHQIPTEFSYLTLLLTKHYAFLKHTEFLLRKKLKTLKETPWHFRNPPPLKPGINMFPCLSNPLQWKCSPSPYKESSNKDKSAEITYLIWPRLINKEILSPLYHFCSRREEPMHAPHRHFGLYLSSIISALQSMKSSQAQVHSLASYMNLSVSSRLGLPCV